MLTPDLDMRVTFEDKDKKKAGNYSARDRATARPWTGGGFWHVFRGAAPRADDFKAPVQRQVSALRHTPSPDHIHDVAGFAKLATGVVSTITAVMLWRLIPKALAIPTQSTLAARNRELERLAVTDSLTGLWNRREIMKRATDELARSNRYGHRLSVMKIDIDLFKSINDEHGHQVGDRVLEQVAQVIQTTCRQSDSVDRYGGEEFLLICPETDQQAGTQLADRVRLAVAALDLSFVRVTCSIGVSSHVDGQTLDELIATADHALYAAKQRGRNQIAYE